ncbi:MAG: hypothetical protein E3J87_08460 [Candidatus Cloacimonadota bacterium]|nr:MAG: hypothetical protein E3J87_08460 [Candidatus Cloacimonadota bacterium]
MKKSLFLLFIFPLLSFNLFATEKDNSADSSALSHNKIYFNYLLNIGVEGFNNDKMKATYGLTPVLNFEFRTTVSPGLDGVIDISFSRKKGGYSYYDPFGWPEVIEKYNLTLFYEKIGLGLRICDKRFYKRTPFLDAGLDAVYAKEWRDGYSGSGSAMGSHFAIGFSGNINKNWIFQVKGRLQFLSIPMKADNYYSSKELDLSGVGMSIGIGFSK